MLGKKLLGTVVYVRKETIEEMLSMLRKKILGTVVYVKEEILRNCCLCQRRKPEKLLSM